MLEVGGGVHQERHGTAQLPQFVEFRGRDITLLVAAKTKHIGDNEAIPLVGFDLADVEVPQGIGLDGVEDADGESLFPQGRVQGQPVMAGGFHADDKMIGVSTEGQQDIQKPLEARNIVFEAESLVCDLSGILQNNGLMAAFGDVDAYDEHGKTPRRKSSRQHLSVPMNHILLGNEKKAKAPTSG